MPTDRIIDLSSEGSADGGGIVATGTPEDVAKVGGPYIGAFLKPVSSRTKDARRRGGAAVGGHEAAE